MINKGVQVRLIPISSNLNSVRISMINTNTNPITYKDFIRTKDGEVVLKSRLNKESK